MILVKGFTFKKRNLPMLLEEKLRHQSNMSPGEKSVADHILSLGKELKRYSTRNLADLSYTSPPTVIRLCKKMGYSGFEQLKEQYCTELDYLEQDFGQVDVNFPFDSSDTLSRAVRKMGRLYEETVKDTLSIMQYDMLQKAVTLIKYCNTIYVFSAGTTLNLAVAFKEKMMKIGRSVAIPNNLNYQQYEVNCMQKRDLALIISYSGETGAMIQAANTCKEKEIPILAITSFGDNTLSRLATCKLLISTRESLFYNIGDFSSHISVSFLLDTLYGAYFLQDYEKNYDRKLELVQQMEKLRHSDNPCLTGQSRQKSAPPKMDASLY